MPVDGHFLLSRPQRWEGGWSLMNFRMTSASCCFLIGQKRLHVERSLTFLDDVSILLVKNSYIL